MSWRETLGVTSSTETPYTHNSQNAQKPSEPGNCADIADSVCRSADKHSSKLPEALAHACAGSPISPAELQDALAPEDLDDWREGKLDQNSLAAFARSLVQRREMDQGVRPANYTAHAICKHCGPVWLWFSGDVQGCPWCWNRVAERPIPRPAKVRCVDCSHFRRSAHPHLGHCTKGQDEAASGLRDTDRRNCSQWVPLNAPQGDT